eukprot:822242-Rhodomonas_salina.1
MHPQTEATNPYQCKLFPEQGRCIHKHRQHADKQRQRRHKQRQRRHKQRQRRHKQRQPTWRSSASAAPRAASLTWKQHTRAQHRASHMAAAAYASPVPDSAQEHAPCRTWPKHRLAQHRI